MSILLNVIDDANAPGWIIRANQYPALLFKNDNHLNRQANTMTDVERKELKKKMLEQIEALRVDIRAHKESSKPVEPDVAIGRLTRMEAIGAKHISEANLASASNRLARLERALRRIDTDEEFGLCSECDEPIPLRRLMLLPESTRCVRCAEG